MHAQILFCSRAETTVLVDLIVLDDAGDELRHVGAMGQPVTVAFCLDGGELRDVARADHQFDEWANAMTVVELRLVEDHDATFLRVVGPTDELTLELATGFRWSYDG